MVKEQAAPPKAEGGTSPPVHRLRWRRRAAGLVLGLVCTLLPAAPAPSRAAPAAGGKAGVQGAQAPQAAGDFAETTEVTAVQVPVQVVRDGEPVRGLTAADFEVYEGRKKQALTGFEVLDLSAPPPAPRRLPPGTAAAPAGPPVATAAIPPALRRHFLFLFDLTFSEPPSLVKARQMVHQMLPDLAPTDLVAVGSVGSGGIRLHLGFTTDRRQVGAAVDNLGAAQVVDRNPDPLQLMASQYEGGGRTGADKTEINQDLARTSEVNSRQEQEGKVGAFTRSFVDLAHTLAGIPGRKQVIYLSEGFDSSLLQGTANIEDQRQMAEISMGGLQYQIDSDQRYGQTRGTNLLEKMLEELRRADCVIQSIDIGGARIETQQTASSLKSPMEQQGKSAKIIQTASSGEGQAPVRASGEGPLFAMAHDTGGELYKNFNDLGEAMGQLLKKTGLTYVLTFQPADLKPDGSYHPLRVVLRKGSAAGPRAQVFARTGYYAPKPYRQQTARERRLSAAEVLVGGVDGGVLRTAVLAVPFAAVAAEAAKPEVKAFVPVLVEADGGSLLNGAPGDVLGIEVYAYALNAAGEIQDFFTQRMRFEVAKVMNLLDQTGLKFFGHVDLPPGEYNLRVLVRNVANGDYGLRSQSVVVAAPGSPAAAELLPPFFPEAPSRWLMVHEAPRGDAQEQTPYPFVVKGRVYVPALRPVLAPAQQIALALIGFHLPAENLEAQAKVITADGREAGEASFQVDGREPPDAGGVERLTATFRPPPNLPPGDYRLVIAVRGPHGVACQSSGRFVVAAVAGGARG